MLPKGIPALNSRFPNKWRKLFANDRLAKCWAYVMGLSSSSSSSDMGVNFVQLS